MTDTTIEVNTVLRRSEDHKEYRVLWTDGISKTYWICLGENGNIPKPVKLEELLDGTRKGLFEFAVDTWMPAVFLKDPSPKDIARRNRSWEIVKDIVSKEPDIYDPGTRIPLLQEASVLHGIHVNNIYKLLGRYWKRGKIPDAFLPDYYNVGKTRDLYKESSKRSGRPKKDGAMGKKLTPQDHQYFTDAINKYYLTKDKLTLDKTFSFLLRDHYSIREPGKEPVLLPPDELPSLQQFTYWHRTHRDKEAELRSRNGDRDFELNRRAVTGRTDNTLMGPGSQMQIDATIADIYLVRRDDRLVITKRPVMYFVMDSATRMVIGMHVTLDNPSWASAAIAINNTTDDKVSYCRRFGIEITPEEWPCHYLPSVLMADRGEVESITSDRLTQELGITVENAPPYRGDLKGIIESHFHLINLDMTSLLPGKVMKDFGTRGSDDYRLEAQLDIWQFTAIIIRCVLHYNNAHYLKEYDKTPQMRQLGVRPVPLELWNYGIRYQSGILRTMPKTRIRYALLPRREASITAQGILFSGRLYTCKEAEEGHWFSDARTEGRRKVTVAYDPSDNAVIYLQMSGMEDPLECFLITNQNQTVRLQDAEVASAREDDASERVAYEPIERASEVKLVDFIDSVITAAQKAAPSTKGISKASRLQGIRRGTIEETQSIRDENTRQTLLEHQPEPDDPEHPQSKSAAVSPINRMLREAMEEVLGKEAEDENDPT